MFSPFRVQDNGNIVRGTCVGIEQLSAMMGDAQAAPGRFSPVDMMQGNGAMSQLFTFMDEMDQAIAHANAAYQIVRHANRDKKCL